MISSGGFYGAESMLVNLAKALDGGACQNTIGVFRNTQNPHIEVAERAKEAGLDVEIISCEGRADRRPIREIQNLIYQNGIDVVHAHGSKANVYAALAAGPLGVPLVATYHLDWPDRGLALYCYHVLDRLILRRYQKVIAVSDAIERSLRRSGLSRKKLKTIANGIDCALLQPGVAAPVKTKDKQDTTLIGVVGRLTLQKGHKYLIQAAPSILSKYPEVLFVFVGDGPERESLQQMVSSLGIEDRVMFWGVRSDMPAVYRSLDLVVLPSINEGMPMTVIEALAARRPVIATRVGDVAKLIHDGRTGLLVEPADPGALESAITRCLADPDLRANLAAEGQRLMSENFSSAAMARQYYQVYESLLSAKCRA